MLTTRSTFTRERTIRFSDCDPAGIVFYPQYFVMFNGLVEDWFNDALNISYPSLIMVRRMGLPTVHLDANFRSISKMGDRICMRLAVERMGGKSIRLHLQCLNADDGQLRMETKLTMVTTSLETHQAITIPDDIRQAIAVFGFIE